jgi:hypothetical protein
LGVSVHDRNFPEWPRKTTKYLRMAGVPAEIGIEHLQPLGIKFIFGAT